MTCNSRTETVGKRTGHTSGKEESGRRCGCLCRGRCSRERVGDEGNLPSSSEHPPGHIIQFTKEYRFEIVFLYRRLDGIRRHRTDGRRGTE